MDQEDGDEDEAGSESDSYSYRGVKETRAERAMRRSARVRKNSPAVATSVTQSIPEEGAAVELKTEAVPEDTTPDAPNDDGEPESLTEEAKVFCYCQKAARGNMIGCDNEACPTEWFHQDCVGLDALPDGKWFCRDCSV